MCECGIPHTALIRPRSASGMSLFGMLGVDMGADEGDREFKRKKALEADAGPVPTWQHSAAMATKMMIIFTAAGPGIFMLLDALYVAPLTRQSAQIHFSNGTWGADRYKEIAAATGLTRATILGALGVWMNMCCALVWSSVPRMAKAGACLLCGTFIVESCVRVAMADDWVTTALYAVVCLAHVYLTSTPPAATAAPPHTKQE